MLNFRTDSKRYVIHPNAVHSGFRAFSSTLFFLLTCLACPPQSLAHRQHLSWSTIVWNEQASMLEITHRVHAHDASTWLRARSKTEIDITDIQHQARFALYSAERFKLQNNQSWQAPELLGAELKGNYFLTYQQLHLDAAPTSLFFEITILMDLFDDQEHIVNVESSGGVKSLSFDLQNTYQGVQI
jgi:hypothetical protein